MQDFEVIGNRMIRKIFMVGSLLLVGGCGGTPHIALAPTVQRAPQDELPRPDGLGPDGKYIYTLGPLDTISIEVDGMPDLLQYQRNQVVVDGQGMIAYPLAGSVSAAGLTTTQLARTLEERMRENHVRNPRVNVNLVTQASNVVTVGGEVNKPGLYPVANEMTLMQAVALASGVNDNAESSVVLVFRDVGSQHYVGLYNLKAISYGNYADPKIYPNDKVIVGEDQARRLVQLVGPFVSLITTPLIYLINRSKP
jgi:polysaccharide export outer membrane protein